MSRSGGPLWPGKPGNGSGGRKGENQATEVEGVQLSQEEAGELTRSGGPLWPGKPGSKNGHMKQDDRVLSLLLPLPFFPLPLPLACCLAFGSARTGAATSFFGGVAGGALTCGAGLSVAFSGDANDLYQDAKCFNSWFSASRFFSSRLSLMSLICLLIMSIKY